MGRFEERYLLLNDKQKEAVDCIEGPLMVVAGPGSGKTELLAIRTANILKQTQISPYSILLLTFTDSASVNMRERLVSLIGETGYRVSIHTFHGFAGDIMRHYGEYFFGGMPFTLVTDAKRVEILQNILESQKRDNTLTSKHPEKGFVFIKSIIESITNLKRSGLTIEKYLEKLAENDEVFKKLNLILKNLKNDFFSINNKKKLEDILPTFAEFFSELQKIEENDYTKILSSTLELAIFKANEEKSTSFLTEWKNNYLEKVEHKGSVEWIIRDSREDRIKKLKDFATVYEAYNQKMYEFGMYDYDDMILLVSEALQKNANLRYDLQERYQYVLIDEFQDTNEAQFSLARSLYLKEDGMVDAEGNIMVVGDDDQAIYKFQGAEIGNIFDFKKTFSKVKVIVLDKNYRSTQQVLDLARKVIVKAEDRLEVRDKNIIKDIKSSNPKFTDFNGGQILEYSFESPESEKEFIVGEIQDLISKGVNPKEIAVICRVHNELKNLSNIMSVNKIPHTYQKKEHVLDQDHIKQLLNIVRFASLSVVDKGYEMLSEILSYPFWNIEKLDIWKLALNAQKNKDKNFLEHMYESNNQKIKETGIFLAELTVDAQHLPLERLIDKIIGSDDLLADDSEKSDEEIEVNQPKDFLSSYRPYYFNQEIFTNNKQEYLEKLFTLRTLIEAIREFKSGEILYAKDIDTFLDIYTKEDGITLSANIPFASSQNSISLLTAHSAKGLEFEYVFILSADDQAWRGKGNTSGIAFPKNMLYGPGRDNDDDKIRLLFVALTRAKHTLYITHSKQKVRFLDAENSQPKNINISDNTVKLFLENTKSDFVEDEKILLQTALQNYAMPVTHLNNYLNFTRVGPQKFIEQNILRFPQAITAPAVYGIAVHSTFEYLYKQFFLNKEFLKIEELKNLFIRKMKQGRLTEIEFKKYTEDGLNKIENYYEYLKKIGISDNTKVEVSFKSENIKIGSASITGNLDRLEVVEGKLIITDMKTGKSFYSFDQKNLDDDEKIKLHFYKYQLAFYGLLLNNSKEYSKYRQIIGRLEFVDGKKNEIETIEVEIDNDLVNRIKDLTEKVYEKIMNLDFPSTENYPKTLKGILQFEEDLLHGKI